jgi:glycosyltransferase involved in cell wall biosynthesis
VNKAFCGELLSIMPIRMANIVMDGRFGGPQNQILQVSEKLQTYGIETLVIIPKKDSETFYANLIARKISVKRLFLHRLTKHLPELTCWLLFFVPELFSLVYYLRKANIELVQCTGAWQVKGILAGKLARVKIIWRLQDTWMPPVIKILFNVLAIFFCDGFIVAGNRVRQYYLNIDGLKTKKAMEIQACVDTSRFNPNLIKEDKLIGNAPGTKITTVGNVNDNKGLEYFVEMVRILNNKYKDLNFYVVGPHFQSQKKYSEKLYELVSRYHLRNIFFYGRSNDIPSILKATDIYVCSSIREASPNAVWEAMAMEKAIVSTAVGDVKRFVRNGENGFVVPPANAQAIAEKVGILIENESLRNKFGKCARIKAMKELDVELCTDHYRKFYLDVLRT